MAELRHGMRVGSSPRGTQWLDGLEAVLVDGGMSPAEIAQIIQAHAAMIERRYVAGEHFEHVAARLWEIAGNH